MDEADITVTPVELFRDVLPPDEIVVDSFKGEQVVDAGSVPLAEKSNRGRPRGSRRVSPEQEDLERMRRLEQKRKNIKSRKNELAQTISVELNDQMLLAIAGIIGANPVIFFEKDYLPAVAQENGRYTSLGRQIAIPDMTASVVAGFVASLEYSDNKVGKTIASAQSSSVGLIVQGALAVLLVGQHMSKLAKLTAQLKQAIEMSQGGNNG